mgnify:CR=1 FL=1
MNDNFQQSHRPPMQNGRPFDFQTPSGKGTGAWFMTCWITNGLNLPEKLNFIKIPKHTHQTTNN